MVSATDLQATVDLVGVGISHLSMNQQVLWANPFYCRFLGYSLDELRHINIRQTTHADDRALQGQMIGKLATGELKVATWDKRFVRKNGTLVWGRLTASLVLGDDGQPHHFVAITSDLTAAKQAEQDLLLNRRQLEDAEDIAHFGSWERDLVNPRLNWSAGGYRLFGLDPTRTTLTFALFLSMVHDEDRPRLVATLERTFRDGTDFEIEYRIHRADGALRVLHVRGRLFKDEQGKPLRSIGTMQDVTELRRHEQTIAEQQQALVHSEALAAIGSLAASVAHEINNPLAYVLLNLEAVLANPGDAAQPRLQEALDGVRRVGAIVKTLKALSGLHAPEPGAVDVRTSIDAAVSMAWNGIAPRAKLVKDLSAVPPVLGDEVRLAQVFLNLLVNASAAIEEGHPERNEIRVVTSERQGEAVVEVRDTGGGIPPEHLGRIFEPFFSTKSRAKGTGLGLPISRRIVEEAGGRIEVTSQPGRGTSFFVFLKLAPATLVAPKLAAPTPATGDAPRLRVLVADDERLIRRAIARALHKCVIVEAESGDQARALLEGDRDFDVVLCDMMMPGLSGMDLHEWLSQVDPALTARMVFITGGAFTPPARAFLERPDVRRLDKPFEGAALRDLVLQVAQLRHPAG